jgi:hypothetical protein
MVSALVGDATIRRGTSESSRIDIPQVHLIRIADVRAHGLLWLSQPESGRGVRIRFEGKVGLLDVGAAKLDDWRMSCFDVLWLNPQLAILFAIVTWGVPTTLMAIRLFRNKLV